MRAGKKAAVALLLLFAAGGQAGCAGRAAAASENTVWTSQDSTSWAGRMFGEEAGAAGDAEDLSGAAWEAGDLLDAMDLQEIEESLAGMMELEDFSFTDLVRGLIAGEIPLDGEAIWKAVRELLFAQISGQKNLVLQILAISLIAAVFSNFIRVFGNSQIAEISFYMLYLLISALLVRSFLAMDEIAADALTSVASFMKVLLPSYLLTVVFAAGGVSALGFYQLTLLAVHILQEVIIKIVLPLIQFYVLLLILNQMTKEDYFSQFASLLRTASEWIVRTAVGITVGLQAVQCLTAPAVDSLKSSAAHRLAKAIPGVGNVIDAAAETVAASAVVIKNAVGVAGILALAAICLVPFLKLAVSMLLFRLLCALIQPISEKRMVDCMESFSAGAGMLMRVLLAGTLMFLVSLAMITASVKGG